MKRILTWLLFLYSPIFLLAQEESFMYDDFVYVDNICTVQFGPAGFQYHFPLLSLGDGGQLLLSFDDMEADVKDYVYKIVHCDRDWTPSTLAPLEYIQGFEEDDIQFYQFSFNTVNNYTYYEVAVPNRNMNITKSGNYVLVVYEDEEEKFPVITRRFVVVDRRVGIRAQLSRPAQVTKIRTHQEVDFAVDHQQLNVRNPMMELRAAVLQNRRWDNAITEIEPRLMKGSEALFDFQNRIVFPAANEFRFIDLRSLRAPQSDIDRISREADDRIIADLAPLTTRAGNVHLAYGDLNGGFAIENFDQREADFSSEYVDVMITYKPQQNFDGEDLYFISSVTDWHVKPEYRLQYNPAISAYIGTALLKQGYYNYQIVTVDKTSEIEPNMPVSTAKTEGNYDDTENDYLILVYYRPFGTRYDQVVGAYQFNSQQN